MAWLKGRRGRGGEDEFVYREDDEDEPHIHHITFPLLLLGSTYLVHMYVCVYIEPVSCAMHTLYAATAQERVADRVTWQQSRQTREREREFLSLTRPLTQVTPSFSSLQQSHFTVFSKRKSSKHQKGTEAQTKRKKTNLCHLLRTLLKPFASIQ